MKNKLARTLIVRCSSPLNSAKNNAGEYDLMEGVAITFPGETHLGPLLSKSQIKLKRKRNMVVNESESTPYSMSSIHIWIVFIFSLLYIQCNERVKVLYILLCNIFNHMKKYKFQTDPSSEFQTRSSSELVSWDRTYFSKLDPVRNSELGAVWKMLPFQIMLHCNIIAGREICKGKCLCPVNIK